MSFGNQNKDAEMLPKAQSTQQALDQDQDEQIQKLMSI